MKIDPWSPWLGREPAGQPSLQVREAAAAFEALLLAQMLRRLRESGGGGWMGGGGDDAGGRMVELAEQQLAQALAAQGGLGLGAIIANSFEPDPSK